MNRVTARGALRWPPRCVTAAYAVTKHAAAPHSLTVPSATAALESRASSFWLGHAGITASGRAITRRDARWRAAYSLWLGLTGNSAGGRVISCRDADATRATNSRNGGPRLHYWAHWYHRERPRHLAPRRRRHQGGTASGSNTPSRRCYRWWQTASSVWLGLTGICASGRVNSRREAGATKAAMPAGATRHRAPAAAGGSLRHHSGWGSPISVSLGLRDSRGGKR